MDIKSGASVVAGLLAAAVVVVLVVGGFGGSTSVQVTADAFEPEALTSGVMVASKHETGGLEVFGFRLKPRKQSISVGVAAAPECITQTGEGEERLAGEGPCTAYADIAGPVVGGGITSEGVRWVEVMVDVDRECYQATSIGGRWPGDNPACA